MSFFHKQLGKRIDEYGVKKYSYKEVELATHEFHDANILGRGRSGVVYRGIVDRQIVAVKLWNVLKATESSSSSTQFTNELHITRSAQHPNIIRVLGYFDELRGKGLVYEYMSNGSLADYFSSKAPFSWSARMKIAIEVAEALESLHQCRHPISHGGLKDTSILLDEHLNAKLSGFGEAMLDDGSDCLHHQSIKKRDIFAYGRILLQLLSGRPATYKINKGLQTVNSWAHLVLAKDPEVAAVELLDPVLGRIDQVISLGVGNLAAKCIVENERKRPDIDYVLAQIQTLGSSAILQDPHGVDKETDYEQVIANARAEKILAHQQVAIVKDYMQSSKATLSAVRKGEEGARVTIESSQEMINNFQKIGISAKKLQSSAGRVEEAMQAVMAAADAKIEAAKRKATI